jgi:hypothetical protein
MTKEGVKYATENGKMLALSAVNGLQNLYKNGVERAKAAGQDVRVFTAQVREAIKS